MFGHGRRGIKKGKTIGVAGICHGSGTTYIAMMLAYYASKIKGEITAVIESNLSGELLLWCRGEAARKKGIDIYAPGEMEENSYTCQIYDFGVFMPQGHRMDLFYSCGVKLVTAGLSPWKQAVFDQFTKEWDQAPAMQDVIYLLPFATSAQARQTAGRTGHLAFSVASEPCWYRQGAQNLKLWERIWQEWEL